MTIVFNREGDHAIRLVHRGDKQNVSSGYRIGLVQAVIESALSMQTLLYAYDSQGRLLSADTYAGTDTTATPIREEAFSFDTASNRTSASLDGVTTTYTYNAANQLTSDGSTSYSYDANGNLTTGGNTWYRNNKLANAGGIDYAYNGLGQRVAQTASSVTTQYLLDVQPGLANVIRKDDGSNTDYMTYLGSTIWQHNGVDAWHFALPDGLGSVRHVLDENMNTVYTTDYSAYGETFNSMGANPMDYGYTGQPLDANGLAYHRARYYDASMGVWNSQDPLELMNRYGYVDGNPIGLVDPSGYSCESPFASLPSTTLSKNGYFADFVSTGTASQNGQQAQNTCLPSPSGSTVNIKPDFYTAMFNQWGVLLTVACDEPTLTWSDENRNKLRTAFQNIEATSINFKNTFGGLEIRLTNGDIGGANVYATSNQNNPRILTFDIDWQRAPFDAARRNVIHELGHVLDYRTRHLPNGIFNTIATENGRLRVNRWDVTDEGWLGNPLAEGQERIIETAADLFYFWVEPSIPYQNLGDVGVVAYGGIMSDDTISLGFNVWAEKTQKYLTRFEIFLANYGNNSR